VSVSAWAVAVATAGAVLALVVGGDARLRRPPSRRLVEPAAPGAGRCSERTLSAPVVSATAAVRRLGRAARRLARRRGDPAADLRVGAALVGGASTAVVLGPWFGCVVAVGVATVLLVVERRAPARRDEDVRDVLPDVVDLFRLAAGAGLSVHQSVAVVTPAVPDPVGEALREVGRQVGLGVRLGDALSALDVLGDAARPLASALTGAARYGAPLAVALDRVAVDARLLRRRRAEERARRLPVQLLFPLVMCVLPAFVLLAVVPLLAGSFPSVVPAP
jgi:Flp pilus assembly protein TadB